MKVVRLQRLVRAAIITAGVVVGSGASLGAQTPADNTKVNTRDKAPGEVTADQQKINAADQKLTQTIRK